MKNVIGNKFCSQLKRKKSCVPVRKEHFFPTEDFHPFERSSTGVTISVSPPLEGKATLISKFRKNNLGMLGSILFFFLARKLPTMSYI